MKTSEQERDHVAPRGVAGAARSTAAPVTPPSARRLPTQRRERKPTLAAVAVLLILGGALASGLLVIRSGQRSPVIVIAKPVAAGQQIPLDAMREGQLAGDGVDSVPWSQRAQVARYFAKNALEPGTVLTPRMVSASGGSVAGRLVLGLALKPGQLPAAGLAPGDHVRVYAVGSSSGGPRPGTVLSAQAVVYGVAARDSGDRLGTNAIMVSVAVAPEEAPLVAQAASNGQAAVALVPPGSGLTDQGGATRGPTPGPDTGG